MPVNKLRGENRALVPRSARACRDPDVATSHGSPWPQRRHRREWLDGDDKLAFNITHADVAAFTGTQIDDNGGIEAVPAIRN